MNGEVTRLRRARGVAEDWATAVIVVVIVSPPLGVFAGWAWRAFRWAAGW